MFQISSEIDDNPLSAWSSQKVSNVHCMVQVIRALVAPSGPAQVIVINIVNKYVYISCFFIYLSVKKILYLQNQCINYDTYKGSIKLSTDYESMWTFTSFM